MVLIVMRDYEFLQQQKELLEGKGFEVVATSDEKEVENIISKIKPELSIVDIIGEHNDSGFVMSYKLKKKYPDVPLILCSSSWLNTGLRNGVVSDEDKKWVKADYYFEKETNKPMYLKVIHQLLEIEQ